MVNAKIAHSFIVFRSIERVSDLVRTDELARENERMRRRDSYDLHVCRSVRAYYTYFKWPNLHEKANCKQ